MGHILYLGSHLYLIGIGLASFAGYNELNWYFPFLSSLIMANLVSDFNGEVSISYLYEYWMKNFTIYEVAST